MFKKYCVLAFGLMMTPALAKPFAYVANINSGLVSIIDLVTNKTMGQPIPVGEGPTSIVIYDPDAKKP